LLFVVPRFNLFRFNLFKSVFVVPRFNLFKSCEVQLFFFFLNSRQTNWGSCVISAP